MLFDFNRMSGKRIRDTGACLKAYSFALELFDKHVTLPSAPNAHYGADALYAGLMQLSMSGGYAESTMDDLALRYGVDAPCGGAFLYRLKKLDYDGWFSRLRDVNDAVLSMASGLGLLKRPVVCAIDYTKVPYYGRFNRHVVRSKHEDGTGKFYEYATISIVQDGLRLCVYSRPVTLLDAKVDVVRELVREAERRGVKVKLLLMDRAFFTVECINLLKGLGVKFITPCVCNERVKRAVDSLGREGRLPFSIRDSHQVEEASFTMVVCWSKRQKKLIPFATNVEEGDARRLVRKVPKEYRRRWGIETTFRKVKEVYGMTTSPSPAIRLAYFMTAMILYNLWQAINITLTAGRRPHRRRGGGYRITMPLMVTIFCAHLNGRV
jgi:hypothetical protein